MKHAAFVSAILVWFLFLPAGAGAADLWSQAVEHYREHRELVPGRMEIRFDQYNGRGKLVSEQYSEIEISVGPDGEIEGRTLFASRDGKDVTDERQDGGSPPFGASGDDADSDSPFAGLTRSPFDPDEQERVRVVDAGRTERIGETSARVFYYEHTTSESNGTSGIVWIEQSTGTPIRLTASIRSLPGYVDTFEMVQEFGTDHEGRWFMTRMEFTGEGNILFVRRRIESKFAFADYFAPDTTALN